MAFFTIASLFLVFQLWILIVIIFSTLLKTTHSNGGLFLKYVIYDYDYEG